MKRDTWLKSLFVGRNGAAVLCLVTFYLQKKGISITADDQRAIFDIVSKMAAQYGLLAAAGMAAVSKIREILRGKKGKLS